MYVLASQPNDVANPMCVAHTYSLIRDANYRRVLKVFAVAVNRKSCNYVAMYVIDP